MATLSALRAELQRVFQDTTGNTLSAVPANQFINNAIEDFVNWTEPLIREYAWPVVAYQQCYTLPSDWIKPKLVQWYLNGPIGLAYMGPGEFQDEGLLSRDTTSTSPVAYTLMDGKLYLGPPSSSSSTSSTINMASGLGGSDDVVTLADASNFHSPSGYIKIEDEIILYQSVSGNDLGLLLRGQGGTTAAAHSNGQTVTQCDLVAAYYYSPPALTADSQSPAFDARWHRLILHRALWQAFTMAGRTQEARDALTYYETKIREAKRSIQRAQRDNLLRIKRVYR